MFILLLGTVVCFLFLNFGSVCQCSPFVCEYFNMNDSITKSNLELERLCTGKHKGCSKLGVKCHYRNFTFLQSKILHMNLVLLWQYSILVACSSFTSCQWWMLKVHWCQYKCVFCMLNCWSITADHFCANTALQSLFGCPCHSRTAKSNSLGHALLKHC